MPEIVEILYEFTPKSIINVARAQIEPSYVVPRVIEKVTERNVAFQNTQSYSVPVCCGFVMILTNLIVVKLRNFSVVSFRHHPLNAEKLFVKLSVCVIISID